MKSIFIFLLSSFTAISVLAQSTVTINLRGNSNRQIEVDGIKYAVSNDADNQAGNKYIILTGLQPGQHRLNVINTDALKTVNDNTTIFNLRSGFDLQINVTNNGSVQLKETLRRTGNKKELNVPMANASFSTLYENARRQRSAKAKLQAVSNAFAKNGNYFTSAQAAQLITLIKSENNRFEQAKASYRTITDPINFTKVHALLNSISHHNQLTDYVNNYNEANPVNTGNSAMTTAGFNTIYTAAQKLSVTNARVNYLSNSFSNANNYFSVSQVSQLIQLVTGENNRLYLAKISYPGIIDSENFSRIYELLNNQSSKNELEAFVKNNGSDPVYSNPVQMSDVKFNTLLQDIKNQWPVSTQLNSITNAFNNTNNFFTSYQASQLIKIVTAENNRLQLAKISYRSVIDPANFNQVYNLLSTQESRDELSAFVNNTDYNPKGAMSDANFNSLMQEIKTQWQISTQMNSLTTAFNNTNNFFTSYQASQLIQIISAENNRLQLAKLSYRSITDPANFNQVYNLLSTQANRDELSAFVNNTNGNPKVAMTDANFNTLIQEIKTQWQISTQMNSLTTAFNNTNNFFTSYQASQLIQIVSAENNRLQLAKISYRSITDPANFNQVYNLLNTQASRDELSAFVNNTSYNPKAAMSDANFNTLIQDIRNQWPVTTQMSSLTSTFNNSNNFFTSYQASQLIQIVTAESNRLQLAKLSYRSITDPANFNQVYNLLSTQASRDELSAFVNNTSYNPKAAMSDANFNTLIQDIRNQWPVTTQMSSLTSTFNNSNNFFTSYQASQLIQIVTAESNRLQLAKLSYRSITDPANFNQVYNLLSTQASRDELSAYVNNNNYNPKAAMSNDDYNYLYQTIQRQYFPGEKMNSLTNAFNNPSYYFTSAQAKQLIQLVSLESNKLQLAKLSYRTITDRSNFSILYALFNNQANKDELDAYVKAYKD